MNEEKSTLDAMLAQYEAATTLRKEGTAFSLSNYFTTYLEDGIDNKNMVVRILPIDGTPFQEVHVHSAKVDGKNRKFVCPSHMKDEPCPFCETREQLLASGDKSDADLAKTYNARVMYIVKVIDRSKEADGPKFWRFPKNFKKEGILDKIMAIVQMLKVDITHPETGRDLALNVVRVKNPRGGTYPTVNSINSLDASPLSDNPDTVSRWSNDGKNWDDVYTIKNYDYLSIVVNGGSPVWSKLKEKFVDKESETVEAEDVTSDLDSELTIGKGNAVENVESAGLTKENSNASGVDKELDTDDLPF